MDDNDFQRYCVSLTDDQLCVVFRQERDRAERYGSDTIRGREAANDANLAKHELKSRGFVGWAE